MILNKIKTNLITNLKNMVEIEFNFNQMLNIIFAELNGPLDNVINKYLNESLLKSDSVYFSINGNIITNTHNTIENFMSDLDKKNKKLKISVHELETNGNIRNTGKEQHFTKTKDFNDSEYKEKPRSNTEIIKNKLSEYIKDNFTNDINFTNIDITPMEKEFQISCNKCKFKIKEQFLNNELYRCLTCQQNLCIMCKLSHDQSHNIINPKINEEIIKRSKTNNFLSYEEQLEDKSIFFRNMKKKMENIRNKEKNIENENSDINKKLNEMTIIYNIDKEKEIKIFDKDFIQNNKNNCYLIINDEKKEIAEYIKINTKKQNTLEIKLCESKTITNMSCMFCECYSLKSLPDIFNWDTKNVTNMRYLFQECRSLISLSDISNWNTKNITDIGH